ncbi:MAG: anthranilate synthase component I family protein [Flavobacteriaceae bacterium]|nr:anthranilate synthase component I family protein [Flavobacteriaceae bacterium]
MVNGRSLLIILRKFNCSVTLSSIEGSSNHSTIRTRKKIKLDNASEFKAKLLTWSQQFEEVVWLDSNDYLQKYSSFEAALAVEAHTQIQSGFQNAFAKLQQYKNRINDYIFGYLSYDLKNDIEELSSNNFEGLDFPELHFFQPRKLFFLKDNELEICYLKEIENQIEEDLEQIRHYEESSAEVISSLDQIATNVRKNSRDDVKIHKRITKKDYLKHLDKILNHIHRGDIYEVNFCQEFYADDATINPYRVYEHLNKISSPPFATFLKIKHKYLLSASPERFVRRAGNKVISQPIKGTAKRLQKKKLDQRLAEQLEADQKERSENIMIVDLVRNDLSKTAIKGSVEVEELCKVYSFKQVHQLISTVISQVTSETDSTEIIKSLFPMGSMTGAPKISAMQIIENEESTKRGLYSGAVGYFAPGNDFDFNVVIRSILYNKSKKYLSYSVGGAITEKSDPEKEYQECLLKAIAMKKALKG